MAVYRNKWHKRHLSQIVFVICSLTSLVMVFYIISTHDIIKEKESLGLYNQNARTKRHSKIIASWNSYWDDPYFEFGRGYEPFQKNECPYQDCYIIHDRDNDVIDQYDAILFHGSELWVFDYPRKRSSFQKYIFFNMESPLTKPISPFYEDFFNVTMTYRLDSDIPLFYFGFFDIDTNEMISPSSEPQWREQTINDESMKKLEVMVTPKWKSVAWIVSDCNADNDRMERALKLREYIDIDIYGKCGELDCPGDGIGDCSDVLKKEYYFYLSYENSNCADYVTEKMLNAFGNDVIPIYYGGADLSKFAPPNSYIDARTMTTEQLGEKIQHLIDNPTEYLMYFWWKDYYKVIGNRFAPYKPFCKLCEMLHNSSLPPKSYDLQDWWEMHDGLPACTRTSSKFD